MPTLACLETQAKEVRKEHGEMKLGPVQGPLTIVEYDRVLKFTGAVEMKLREYVFGRRLTTEARIRYADLPEYPLLVVEFTWADDLMDGNRIRFQGWKSLHQLEDLDQEQDTTYETSVSIFVEKALTSIATGRC